jgi:hypothetical protein
VSIYRPRDKAGKLKSPYWQYDFVIELPNGQSSRVFGSTGLRKKKDAQEFEEAKRRYVTIGAGPGAMTVNDGCWKYWEELGIGMKGAREKARQL